MPDRRVDKEYVEFWSALYDESYDAVLTRVGPSVRERGYYDRNDFMMVGRWKAARTTPLLEESKNLPPYMTYLTICRELAADCQCDLRTLDRALWQANGRPVGEVT